MLEPFKYLIQPVAVERDADGRVVREIPGETRPAYTLEQIAALVELFEAQIAEYNERGGTDAGHRNDRDPDHLRQPGLPG